MLSQFESYLIFVGNGNCNIPSWRKSKEDIKNPIKISGQGLAKILYNSRRDEVERKTSQFQIISLAANTTTPFPWWVYPWSTFKVPRGDENPSLGDSCLSSAIYIHVSHPSLSPQIQKSTPLITLLQPSTTGIILIIDHCLVPSYKGQVDVLRNIKSVNITLSYIERALQMTLKTELTSPPPKLRQVSWCHIYHTSIKPPYSIDTIFSSPWYFLSNHTSFKPWRTTATVKMCIKDKRSLFHQSPRFFFVSLVANGPSRPAPYVHNTPRRHTR